MFKYKRYFRTSAHEQFLFGYTYMMNIRWLVSWKATKYIVDTNNEMRRLDTMDLLLNNKSNKFYYKVVVMTKQLHTDVPTND